jgi:hypothetical protein
MPRARELVATIRSGGAMLFTGAGFSAEARDRGGLRLPDTPGMVGELWPLLFGDVDPPDGSTLADLYDVALLRAPAQLREYLNQRLRVGDRQLPAWFARWFGAPWRRIYTLNVDDLEAAVDRQFALPRPLRSVSALAPHAASERDRLDVVHLNGIAGDDPRQVTFSTMQYAARLCMRDHAYEQLVDDLRSVPFVFVGTTLDEVVLWQHVELQRRNHGKREPPRSFLVSPSLSRARQVLLASHGIHWVKGTAEDIAGRL